MPRIIIQNKCKKCCTCVTECPVNAIDTKYIKGKMHIEITNNCIDCSKCEDECIWGAIESDGRSVW